MNKYLVRRPFSNGKYSEVASRKKIVRRPTLSGVIYHCDHVLNWQDMHYIIFLEGVEVYRNIGHKTDYGIRPEPPIDDEREGEPDEHYWRLLHHIEKQGYVEILEHKDPRKPPVLKWVPKAELVRETRQRLSLSGKEQSRSKLYHVVFLSPYKSTDYLTVQYNDWAESSNKLRIPSGVDYLEIADQDKRVAINKICAEYVKRRYPASTRDERDLIEDRLITLLIRRQQSTSFVIDLQDLKK